jgi:HTH-type transcriptional regulator / antitoxin MqsA
MKTGDITECPLCGGAVARTNSSMPVALGRRNVRVAGDFNTCTSCGEVFLAPGETDRLLRAAADQVRHEENLLASSEIVALRKSLGLTQAQFEQMLGVGPKTVVRWERGTVFQNSATDMLLRVLRDVPEATRWLKRRNIGGAIAQSPSGGLELRRAAQFARSYSYATQMPVETATAAPVSVVTTFAQIVANAIPTEVPVQIDDRVAA